MYQDGRYRELNESWHTEDSPWKAAQILALLGKHALRPTTVAEVGCGAGEVLNCVSRGLGTETACIGYDVSPDAYELCRQRARAGLTFRHADLLAEPGAHFDLLLAIDVFEHVEDYLGFLRRLRGIAEHKIFHIPLEMSVQMVLRNAPILRARELVGHLHYFNKDTALATLRDAGYEIVDSVYTAGATALPPRHWKASLLRLPRRVLFGLHPDLAARVLGGYSLLVLAR